MNQRPRREALPTPPTPRLLMGLGGLLLLIAASATALFIFLQQDITAWPSEDEAQLRAAIAATQPITPLQTTQLPAVVIVLMVGDLRATTPLTSLRTLKAARWQLADRVQPPEAAFATMLRGVNSGGLRWANDHPYTAPLSPPPLTDTLATLVPSRTLMLNPAAPAYLQPSASSVISAVVQATDSDAYDLIVASLPGLLPCHLREFDCARVTAELDAGLAQVIRVANDNDATLIVVGDYGTLGISGIDGSDIEMPPSSGPPLLLLSGSLIKAGTYTDPAHFSDLAPTAAALLGVSPPPPTEGQVLWPALQLTAKTEADAEYSLAIQRARLAEAQAARHDNSDLPYEAQVRANLGLAYEASRVPDYASMRDLSSRAFVASVQQLALVRTNAAAAAGWGRLFLLGGAFILGLAALFIWRRLVGYFRPIAFYLAIAAAVLLLEGLALALLPASSDTSFASLPDDWLNPSVFVFVVLAVALVGQIILGLLIGLLYRRAYHRPPPSTQHAEELQIAIWQLRTVQPLTGAMLWQAAYLVAFALLAIATLIGLIVWWQYDAAVTTPPSASAVLLLLDTLALLAANALLASFVAPLVALGINRLREPRKPHPLLARPREEGRR